MTKGNGKAKETNGKSNGVSLVPQEHGGALNSGGTPGHKGAGGRPLNEIRGTLRDILERGLPALEGYIEGRVPVKMVGKCEKCGHEHADYKFLPTDMLLLQTVKAADRLKAIELAARYGGVDKLALVADELPEDVLTPERKLEIWESLQRINRVSQLEKLLTDVVKKQVAG